MAPILVCESVRATTTAGLRQARETAVHGDLVELRLDGVADPDPEAAIAGRTRPVVVTCRPTWEGGGFDGSEETRARLLERALVAGAEFVDVEFLASCRPAFLNRWADRIVLSWHDFSGVPDDLIARVEAMNETGAAVVKVAVTASRLRDMRPLLAVHRVARRDRRLVVIGMGEPGLATRVLPQRFGSDWTYAGRGVAPGQIPAAELVERYRVRAISAATTVLGVAGPGVGADIASTLLNAALAAASADAVCLPFDTSDFDDFAWAADALGIFATETTWPLSEEAARAAARSDDLARRVGATAIRRESDGSWSARNTAGQALLAPLDGLLGPGVRAAILGAGPTARMAAAVLGPEVGSVTIHAERPEDAARLARELGVSAGEWPPRAGGWDILVNATRVGEWPVVGASPIEASIVHGGTVYDLVHTPPRTALLKAAARNGCRTVEGLDMRLASAAAHFAWWTGRPASEAVLRSAAAAHLLGLSRLSPGGEE